MFKNLHELLKSMPTEKDCRDYLIAQRWDGCPVCPYCGYSGKTYVIELFQSQPCFLYIA